MAIPGQRLERLPYTYLIGWKRLDLWYYGVRYAKGSHPGDLWVGYFTSSCRVAEMVALHGDPDVVMVRKTFLSAIAATAWESRVLRRLGAVRSQRWLNLARGGVEFNSAHPEIRARISAAKMNHLTSAETRKRIGDSRRGQRMSADARLKISEANAGKVIGLETRLKMSEARQGIVFSDETRKRMSVARTGRKDSPETIAKRVATLAARRALWP